MDIRRFLQPMYANESAGGTSKKYLNTRVQLKKDTAANWESANPVILAGEFIIVTTASGETRFKVGDGVKKYTQLPFTDEPLKNLVSGKLGKTEAAVKVQNKLSIFGQDYDGSSPVTIDVIENATTTKSGLMSAEDKKTLEDITPLVVTFTASSTGEITCNKTFAQVKEANDSGRFIYGIIIEGTQPIGWLDTVKSLQTNSFEFSAQFIFNESKKSYLKVTKIILLENNSITFSFFDLPDFEQVENIASAKVTQPFENIDGIIKRQNINGTFVGAVKGVDYAAATHTHSQSQIAGLSDTLDAKAERQHTHAISEVINLEARLAALEAKETGTSVTLYRYVNA